MHAATLSLAFAGEPPNLRPDDELVPPDSIQLDGFVRFERVAPHRVHLCRIPVEDRWKPSDLVYQVARPAEGGGYLLRSVPSGGPHTVAIRALRRIRGHGTTVRPAEAFGILLGWPARNTIHAALPVGRTEHRGIRDDLFAGVEAAMPVARALAESRGLAVTGVYCTGGDYLQGDFVSRVPPALAEGYLVVALGYGGWWSDHCLLRAAPPHGWLPCPWTLDHARVDESRLNPRRIHRAWVDAFGPMDYSHYKEPEFECPPQPRPPPRFVPERDWFAAEHCPVATAAFPHEWQWLAEAIDAGSAVRIRYDGGSQPGSERTVRIENVFTVAGYDAVYLQAKDLDKGEDRAFRLDRISAAWAGNALVMHTHQP